MPLSRVNAGRPGPTAEQTSAQVERILASPKFQGANLSAKLLTFLARWAVDRPDEHLKETELALTVFNRPADSFDPQIDSVVRVQMARLRGRLAEYYSELGQNDPVVLEIPKGGYHLTSRVHQVDEPLPEPVLEPPAPTGRTPAVWITGALAAGLLLGAGLAWLIIRPEPKPGPALHQFWSPFLGNARPTLVVFSNPRLAGTLAVEGLHYYDEAVESKNPGAENMSYSGSGDPFAVFKLTHLMDSFRQNLRIQTGSRLSWDEARMANMIFVGRPEQNPALRRLPRLHEFRFKFFGGIVNVHPQPGEKPNYTCSGRPYNRDYSLIALTPGLLPDSSTLILAGNTTYGSQAAADFVSDENSVKSLLNKLGVQAGGAVPRFEALIEVRITNNTPVWSQLIAARKIQEARNSWEEPPPEER
ncbi:hypothetical protein [uncultured Paludibaculum sp.]|uniref:hypothetical protein n=1 Tax=uncultured Paludibaculum sp. TaxID=1765020 RepID=UPI002AAABA2A|nr:hypothetical protein [uncultured Paludibaculum sp.]